MEINLSQILNKLTTKTPFTSIEKNMNDVAVKRMRECGIAPTAQYNIELRDIIRGKSGQDHEYKDLQFKQNSALNFLLDNSTIFLNCKADAYIPYLEPSKATWGYTAHLSLAKPDEIKTIVHRISNSISLSKSYLKQQTKATEQYLIDALVQSLFEGIFSTLFNTEEGHDISGVFPLFNNANTTNITSKDDVLNMQKNGDLVASDNVWIVSPTAKLKLYDLGVIDNGLILDRPTLFTNLIKDGYFCYISLKHLALCIYDVIGVTVDPYTKAAEGKVNLVVESFCDAQLLHYKLLNVGKFEDEDEPTDGTDEQDGETEQTD